MQRTVSLVLVVVLFSAGCFGGIQVDDFTGGSGDTETLLSACPDRVSTAETDRGERVDPSKDVLGWENGVWFDDPIAVDQSDGLSCEELALALSRTMARVEHLRELEFTFTPETQVIARETYRDRARSQTTAENVRTMRNTMYEALFLVDERTDAVAVQQQNQGTGVAAFYAPSQDRIVIITPDPDQLQINSALLAHELVHTLQDQHFELGSAGKPTTDGTKGRLGLTEGDANYVQYLYNQRCSGEWNGSCLVRESRPARSQPTSGGGPANIGLYLISYQPYSDGPAFVKQLRDARGWMGVNEAYRQRPASTEQTIHPGKYPTDQPTVVTVSDKSTAEWTLLTIKGEPDYETVGEAGLFVAFVYPYYDSNQQFELVSAASFRNRDEAGNPDRFNPYNYRHVYSEGWDGDRLIAYRNSNGEHAYVWKLGFDSPADAREFLDGYRQLLAYRGAERIDGREGVWRINPGKPFADAFSVTRSGDRVLIVNAPTIEELSTVRTDI